MKDFRRRVLRSCELGTAFIVHLFPAFLHGPYGPRIIDGICFGAGQCQGYPPSRCLQSLLPSFLSRVRSHSFVSFYSLVEPGSSASSHAFLQRSQIIGRSFRGPVRAWPKRDSKNPRRFRLSTLVGSFDWLSIHSSYRFQVQLGRLHLCGTWHLAHSSQSPDSCKLH